MSTNCGKILIRLLYLSLIFTDLGACAFAARSSIQWIVKFHWVKRMDTMLQASLAFTEIHHFNLGRSNEHFPFILAYHCDQVGVSPYAHARTNAITFGRAYGHLSVLRRGVAVFTEQLTLELHGVPPALHDSLIDGCVVIKGESDSVACGRMLIVDQAGKRSSVVLSEPVGDNLIAFLCDAKSGGFSVLMGDTRPQLISDFVDPPAKLTNEAA